MIRKKSGLRKQISFFRPTFFGGDTMLRALLRAEEV